MRSPLLHQGSAATNQPRERRWTNDPNLDPPMITDFETIVAEEPTASLDPATAITASLTRKSVDNSYGYYE